CIPGRASSPVCTWTSAKATFIADGDTIDARIPGVGEKPIRFIGINAMELHRYSRYPARRRGDCHGLEATAFVERYIRASRFRVRLASQHTSSRSGHRLRRSVWVRSGGRWKDLARLEIAAGHALWLPNGDEYAPNLEYEKLASRAIAAQRNLYDPDFCGAGPDQDLPLSLAVNWDADGNDEHNLNGEWADVRNGGARPLSLAGWFFRDSFLRYDATGRVPGFRFPASAVVPAGGSVRLRMGCGTDTAAEYHWCQGGSVFENVTGAPRHMGDGGYLFDPQRDLRAAAIFPCVVACRDPLAGKVTISVHPRRPESISVTNTSGAPVDLADHAFKLRNHGRAGQYVLSRGFGPRSVLGAGRTLRYAPDRENVLSDNGGVVELRTLTDILTGCADWGFGRC
ncbi:MAG: hypothetical protein ACR2NB_00660, partial [Solirubrobacteraceae bacterium]